MDTTKKGSLSIKKKKNVSLFCEQRNNARFFKVFSRERPAGSSLAIQKMQQLQEFRCPSV